MGTHQGNSSCCASGLSGGPDFSVIRVMIPEDEVKELSISVEDAFRIIVSGGLASNQSEIVKLGERDDKMIR